MNVWWITNLARFGTEKAAVDALARDAEWLGDVTWHVADAHLIVEATIRANEADYRVKLVYPDQFPLVPAWVAPIDNAALWSGHQFGAGGSLCLELRPDNWHPDFTGAQLLESAHRLLCAENPLGEGRHDEVANAHRASGAQAYVRGANPVLIGEGCLARVRSQTAVRLAGVRWWPDDELWPIYVFDDVDRGSARPPPEGNFRSLRGSIAALAVVGDHAKLSDMDWLREQLRPDSEAPAEYPAVILVVTEDDCVPFHCQDAKTLTRRQLIVVPDDAGARSGRPAIAAKRKVAVIGVGSVGSKIAESLVRSGLRDVVLVDGDVFLPANVERHALDWRDVGFAKAAAMKRRLLEIAPDVQVDVIDQNLFWQQSSKSYGNCASRIADAELLVDATGDSAATLFSAALAATNGRAFLSVQVFEGGIGVAIARAVPDRDPPFVYSLNAFAEYCQRCNVAPPASGTKRYDALTESGEPVIADDAAVTVASGHAARIALDILDGALTDADKAWLLIGLRRAWVFERHGHVICLDVGGPHVKSEPPPNAEIAALAIALAKGGVHATADTA